MLFKSVHDARSTIHVTYSTINNYQYLTNDRSHLEERLRTYEVDGVKHHQGVATWVHFKVKHRIKAPVYLYYELNNVYQNFRTFNDGRSTNQLRGTAPSTWKNKLDACLPYATPGFLDQKGDTLIEVGSEKVPASNFVYNPCGSMPWAMFNDTFTLYKIEDEGNVLVCNTSDFDAVGNPLGGSTDENHCLKKGISFLADTTVRFKKLVTGDRIWSRRYPKPTANTYLQQGWYFNEPGHSIPDPEDYDLQVWMRTALLSRFRKLLRIIDVDMAPGDYAMRIEEYYDVVSFNGKKKIVLMDVGPMGNGTRPIAILFFVMGMVSFVIGIAFGVEACFRRTELFPNMPEPRRSWYVYDPTSPEFELYNALKIRRYVPTVELQALREKQSAQ